MALNIQQQTWLSVFTATLPEFRENRQTPHKLTANYNRNPNWVQPNASDFLSDFEIQARRALAKPGDWSLYWLFMDIYANETKTEAEVAPEVLEDMQWRVGRELRGTMLPNRANVLTFNWYRQGKMVHRAKR